VVRIDLASPPPPGVFWSRVLAYAERMTEDANRVTDDLFVALRGRFEEQQLLELTMRIASLWLLQRFQRRAPSAGRAHRDGAVRDGPRPADQTAHAMAAATAAATTTAAIVALAA
jgi:hypothetical protein